MKINYHRARPGTLLLTSNLLWLVLFCFCFCFFAFFFNKNSMNISYVNTGRPANKCHDASQNSFSNHLNLAQVTNYSLFSLFSVHKILILQSSPENLYPCNQNYLPKQNQLKGRETTM